MIDKENFIKMLVSPTIPTWFGFVSLAPKVLFMVNILHLFLFKDRRLFVGVSDEFVIRFAFGNPFRIPIRHLLAYLMSFVSRLIDFKTRVLVSVSFCARVE